MEGYYPIKEYCKLCRCNKDTAYHRAIRNEIKSFKDEEGRLFIYFTDYKSNIPEGFIPIKEFAKEHNITYSAANTAIKTGRYNPEDVFIVPKGSYAVDGKCRVYIKKTAEKIDISFESKIRKQCPEGYITLHQWRDKHNITKERVGQMMHKKVLNTLKYKDHIYVKEDEPVPPDRRRKENKQ